MELTDQNSANIMNIAVVVTLVVWDGAADDNKAKIAFGKRRGGKSPSTAWFKYRTSHRRKEVPGKSSTVRRVQTETKGNAENQATCC